MGKNAKAGKPNRQQKELRKMSTDARLVSMELKRSFNRRMLTVAVYEAFVILLNVGCIVLHDDHGFGKKRLTDWVNRMLETWEYLMDDYVTINEMADEVIRMTGCRFALTPEEVETMEEFGLKGFAKEVALNDEQLAFMHQRVAQGWENTTNRYGKEVI